MGTYELTLEATANIQQVGALMEAIKNGIGVERTNITVDASQTQRIDSAVIQLLYATKLELKRQGANLRISASEPVSRNIDLLGLSSLLGLEPGTVSSGD
ncbi:MAG: lipid asymmetry maintenance protein MlaB [Thiotrichales bacterium]